MSSIFTCCLPVGSSKDKNKNDKKEKSKMKKSISKRRTSPNDRTPVKHPVSKNLAKFLKDLECPICFNTCTPPIQTCINGHIICANCRKNISCCPTCREIFTGTRNFFAENFINHYSQNCPFLSDGCKYVIWKGENMRPHEKICPFRPLHCIVPSCQAELSYKELLEHLEKVHSVYGTDKIPTEIAYHADEPIISNRKWLPYYIKAYKNIFYVMMEVRRPLFWAWVWLQPNSDHDPNRVIYIVNIRFENKDKNLSFGWSGPVYSIRTPAETIMSEGLCFVGPEPIMQHFEKDGFINLSINIEPKTPNPNQKTQMIPTAPPKGTSKTSSIAVPLERESLNNLMDARNNNYLSQNSCSNNQHNHRLNSRKHSHSHTHSHSRHHRHHHHAHHKKNDNKIGEKSSKTTKSEKNGHTNPSKSKNKSKLK